jgi:hypothetical protein
MALAACSSSSHSAAPQTTTAKSPVPVAQLRAYAETVCGALRGLRTVTTSIDKLVPTLRDDTVARGQLQVQFESLLGAAGAAASGGATFIEQSHVPAGLLATHAEAVRGALGDVADESQQWRDDVAAFDTSDRDNWSDDVLSFQSADMQSGETVWTYVANAVRSGAVGHALVAVLGTVPACGSVAPSLEAATGSPGH